MTTNEQSIETTNFSFSFTAAAAAQIKALAQRENSTNLMLRVRVESGGCSGFQYSYMLVNEAKSDDLIFKNQDSAVVVDPISAPFMENAVLDYRVTLGSAQFEINNPNAATRCGCGNSFGV
jgi:iron-sulfur cluster insertion protein